jgi:hypothetical protein
MIKALSDIDELVLQCHSKEASGFIAEAVSAYKAAAYRSCIVSTWIAIVFDVLAKYRELSDSGDAEAKRRLSDFEQARSKHDIDESLKFEKKLIDDLVGDPFELLSELEAIDIRRILQDRHRCAHPTMLTEDAPYQPASELARLHLWSAVSHLLSKAPLQGKVALDRLIEDVGRRYFPDDVDQAESWLRRSPFGRARSSLIRNFVIVAMKRILDEKTERVERANLITALAASQRIHPQPLHEVLLEKTDSLLRENNDVGEVIWFIARMPSLWDYLSEQTRDYCNRIVQDPPEPKEIVILRDAVTFAPLTQSALTRMRNLEADQFIKVSRGLHWKELFPATLKRLSVSESFRTTSKLISALESGKQQPSQLQLKRFLRMATDNDQVWNSAAVADYLSSKLIFADSASIYADELTAYSKKILEASHSVEECKSLAKYLESQLSNS